MMKVAKLIEELSKLPQDADVYLSDRRSGYVGYAGCMSIELDVKFDGDVIIDEVLKKKKEEVRVDDRSRKNRR